MTCLDLDHLEQYVAGDRSLRDEILTIFMEQAERLRSQLDHSADDEAWRDVVHAMKGSARGVGAWALGDLCEEAEGFVGDYPDKYDVRVAQSEKINAQIDDVIDCCRQTRDKAA